MLLHGFAQNRLAFTLGPLPRLLKARGARVFVAELRGHGRSKSDAMLAHPLETHLLWDLPALFAALDAPVHLIGHSMGGILGYALLGREPRLASLTTIGAPLHLGRGRALTWAAAVVAARLSTLWKRPVPMDQLLRIVAPLSRVRRWAGLASSEHAAPEAIEAILAHADPASVAIFTELARLASARRPAIAGVQLLDAVAEARIPVAAVVGSKDVFGGRASVQPLEAPGAAGPRLVIEVPGGAHVDLTIGHHLPETVARLWPFLMKSVDFEEGLP